jgi:hypothetical protein
MVEIPMIKNSSAYHKAFGIIVGRIRALFEEMGDNLEWIG